MKNILIITLCLLLISSCDSDGDGDSVDESNLQGLWALTEYCIEVRSCEYALDEQCATVGVDDIVDEYIFFDEGTTYECDGTGGDNCWSGTYTLSGSTFEECDDDPNCEEHSNSSDCRDDYGCEWDNDDCYWDEEEGDICTSGPMSLNDDNQTMTIVTSGNWGGCQYTETSTFERIGDSFEDYESLED